MLAGLKLLEGLGEAVASRIFKVGIGALVYTPTLGNSDLYEDSALSIPAELLNSSLPENLYDAALRPTNCTRKQMNTISDIVTNESPTDVILWLVRRDGISHPRLDNLYNRNGWPNIGNCLQLINLLKKMDQDGLIQHGGNGYIKGPNWREPDFLKQKKYEL